MARKPRIDLPGLPQHVVQRGNDRQACFYAPDDYGAYRVALREAADRVMAYRQLFESEVPRAVLEDIRAALNQELAYGSERFKDQIEAITQRRLRPGRPGRPPSRID